MDRVRNHGPSSSQNASLLLTPRYRTCGVMPAGSGTEARDTGHPPSLTWPSSQGTTAGSAVDASARSSESTGMSSGAPGTGDRHARDEEARDQEARDLEADDEVAGDQETTGLQPSGQEATVDTRASRDMDDAAGQRRKDRPPPRAHRLCCRLPAKGGRSRWVIAGPVHDHREVDVNAFTKAIVVESLSSWSSREVYVRAIPTLIKKGVYPSVAATFESIRYIAAEQGDSGLTGEEPSWPADFSETLPIRRVIDRAAAAMTRSGGRVISGSVKFVSGVPLAAHPWYAYAMRLRSKRDERRGAVAFRRAVSKLADDDEGRLLRAGNSAALVAVRHATTYDIRSPAERAQGLRATKKRPWRGVGAPDVIPPRKRLVHLKRRVFERCSRVGHAMITLDGDDRTITWTYVSGSGLSGVRQYRSPNGTVKRLASHTHKQRKSTTPASRESTRPSAAADAATVGQGTGRVHDGGNGPDRVHHDEARGARRVAGDDPAADGSVSEDPFPLDSIFADTTDGASERTGGRLTAEELGILRSSTLENDDGSGTEVIVAVQFDAVAAMASTIFRRTVRCTADDVVGGNAAWSMVSDGGPVRRSTITLFSLALSAPWLHRGRTPMIPVLYMLSGEHDIHTALGDKLDTLLAEAITATYKVPVVGDTANSTDCDTEGAAELRDSAADERFYDWTGPRVLRIVGDFKMLSHIMGITGGSDDSRCPFWWPCPASAFLSLVAHLATHGRPRTVVNVMRQWEFVCWELARWCSLRHESLAVSGGCVTVRCATCGTTRPLSSPLEQQVSCVVSDCPGRPSSTLPTISPTPLTDMLHRLRRRGGGIRAYPVVRSIPIVLQVPVLHCTGTVVKKITHFFLADLGDGPRARARQGIYSVTGRSTLGQLYLREHVKLVALILACEDIVGTEVDSAVLSLWSVSLLLTAAWRQALAGDMRARSNCLSVLELAAGLLAPLWSALKPLDKESKSAGVTSLYLHAALVHARESLDPGAPVDAVVTDDHAEGAVREVGRHCATRVNNVPRAQAVTEFQALADDDVVNVGRDGFAAELMIYTDRVNVCACMSNHLNKHELSDMREAIRRAGTSDDFTSTETNTEAATTFSVDLPTTLTYRPDPSAARDKNWQSKDDKVAAALQSRLRVVNVCICGAAWDRGVGALGRRLAALRSQDGESSTSVPPDAASLAGHFSHAKISEGALRPDDYRGARADGGRRMNQSARYGPSAPAGRLNPAEARLWVRGHTAACLDSRAACTGGCVIRADGNVHEDREDGESCPTSDDDEYHDGGDDARDTGTGPHAQLPHATAPLTGSSAAAEPFLVTEAFKDPVLRKYAPPVELLRGTMDDTNAPILDADTTAAHVRDRISEEDMLLRLFLARMRQPAFIAWAKSENIYWDGMCEAVTSVLRKLHDMRGSLPCSNAFSL